MSRILVTGATGFVGSAVIRALRATGHTLSGTTRAADRPQGPDGVPLYRVPELSDPIDWGRFVTGADAVVHLAARTHMVREQGTDALALYRATNRDGSRRLAEAAAAAGVKRFIFMSSIKAVGEETFGSPMTEASPCIPEDAYGISKYEAEQALGEVASRTGLELVVLRPPLVYGPNVRGNLLALLKACARGWPLPLGGIDNRRSLVSAINLASAVAACLADSRAAGATFFVADGEDISTPDLVSRLSRAMGREPRLLSVPAPILTLAKRVPGIGPRVRRLTGSLQIDSHAIRAALGWAPPLSLDAGLSETAAWYRTAYPEGR